MKGKASGADGTPARCIQARTVLRMLQWWRATGAAPGRDAQVDFHEGDAALIATSAGSHGDATSASQGRASFTPCRIATARPCARSASHGAFPSRQDVGAHVRDADLEPRRARSPGVAVSITTRMPSSAAPSGLGLVALTDRRPRRPARRESTTRTPRSRRWAQRSAGRSGLRHLRQRFGKPDFPRRLCPRGGLDALPVTR